MMLTKKQSTRPRKVASLSMEPINADREMKTWRIPLIPQRIVPYYDLRVRHWRDDSDYA